eukprot:6542370-Prymnesium_polylepis.1
MLLLSADTSVQGCTSRQETAGLPAGIGVVLRDGTGPHSDQPVLESVLSVEVGEHPASKARPHLRKGRTWPRLSESFKKRDVLAFWGHTPAPTFIMSPLRIRILNPNPQNKRDS